jgi:muconolactone delta-isomerase
MCSLRELKTTHNGDFEDIQMQFLSVSRRRTDAFPPEAFTPELVGGEGQRVKELYATGLLRQIWKRADAGGAAILWEAANEAEVRQAIESLPLFKAGMLEVVAFVPLEPYAGFGPAK